MVGDGNPLDFIWGENSLDSYICSFGLEFVGLHSEVCSDSILVPSHVINILLPNLVM